MNAEGWDPGTVVASADGAPADGAASAARLAFSAAGMGWWRWDQASGTVDWSPELEQLYGLEPGTFPGRFDAYVAALHPDDHDGVISVIDDAVARRADFVVEHRVVRPDGSQRWIEGRGSPVLDPDGGVREWVGVAIDVSARVLRDRELRDREIESSIAFAAGRMGSWRWDTATGRGVWSPELEALVGLPEGGFDGTWASFVGPILAEDHDVLRDAVVEATAADRDFSVRYRVRRRDGALRWVETRGRRVTATDWVGVTIDVTELTEVEVEMRTARDRLEETVARLDALLEHASFGFAFVDADERFVRVNDVFARVTGRTPQDHVGEPVSGMLPALAELVRSAGTTGADGRVEREVSGAPAPDGSERHWLVAPYPVRSVDGRPLGAGLMAVDITERRRRERGIRLTGAASELLSESGSPDLLDRMAAIAVPDFADMCVLYVPPRAGVPRRFAVAHREPATEARLREIEARWPQDLERTRAAVGDAGALLVSEVTAAQRKAFTTGDPEEIAFAERHGAASVILVPLRSAARELGLLVLSYTDASGRRYRADDVDLATALGNRFAQLIENEYLAREAERAQSRLDLLAAVSDLLTVDLDTRARLEAIVDVVLPTFADDCAVYLATDSGDLQLAAYATLDGDSQARMRDPGEVGRHDRDGDAPPAVVMRTGEALLIEHVTPELVARLGDQEYAVRLGGAADVSSLIIVPLPGGDEVIGVVAFGLRGADRTYQADDRALAEEIARRVAPAVENALRYERQSATAEALQRSLLPTQLEHFVGAELAARYVPGSDGIRIGGDWYDAVPLPSGRLMVAIGDVVGHGIPAATWMGRLRTLVQFCALDGLAPAAVLERLNDYCFSASGSDMATVLVGVFDPGEGAIEFASAGHPPLVVLRASGAVEVVWDGRGPPLCAVERARFDEARVPLGPGDLLALYTDGLVERRREPFDVGVERLAGALRTRPDGLEATADHVTRALLGDGRPPDDVALLLVAPVGVGEHLDLTLASDARELVGLRRTLRRWLATKGMDDDAASELVVAVNEMAGNAIEHAYGPGDARFDVRAEVADGVVTVEVADEGRWRPRVAGNRGRGLGIAEQLTDDLHVERSERGTTVRMERRIGGAG